MKNEFQDDEDDEYFFNQERLWKKSLLKPTPKELLEIFSEIRETIPKKITESKRDIEEKKQEIKDRLKRLYNLKTDEFSEWFGEYLIKMSLMPELTELEKRLFKLNNLQYILSPKQKNYEPQNFKEKIEIAKQYPIEKLAGNSMDLRKNGTKFIALCPIHNEKTPSFYIYPESNKYYCFGCQTKGDVITLTMTLYGLDFKNAVEMLQN